MCELPVFFASQRVRQGGAQLFSEFVATFGLLAVIWGCARQRSSAVPFAVGAYITSDTFAGIRPADVPGFILAQLLGAGEDFDYVITGSDSIWAKSVALPAAQQTRGK
jgi:hypothetical protein